MKITKTPNHVAIIMDGNGRWAKKRGLPRKVGHFFGGYNIPKLANYANELGIKQLTLYAFSTENWKRPQEEVDYLMTAPIKEVEKNFDKIKNGSLKIRFVGRRDRISKDVLDMINKLEETTKDKTGLLLTIAFDYGSYDEIINAISKIDGKVTKEKIEENLYVKENVDLLIRTSGEKRISNFLLWQISYAELYFTNVHWPSFNKRRLKKAIVDYQKRQRRFGGL